jgi:hypothetical protein
MHLQVAHTVERTRFTWSGGGQNIGASACKTREWPIDSFLLTITIYSLHVSFLATGFVPSFCQVSPLGIHSIHMLIFENWSEVLRNRVKSRESMVAGRNILFAVSPS